MEDLTVATGQLIPDPSTITTRDPFLRATVSLGAGETTVFTQPGTNQGRVDALTVYNPTAGALTCVLHLVPKAGAAGTTNEFCNESLAAKARLSLPAGQVLSEGDIISGSGNGLNVWVSVKAVARSRGFV